MNELPNRSFIISEVAQVAVVNDQYGRIDLATEDGDLISLDLTVRTLAPVIMALFSASSALQERRYAATRERSVLALPVRDAASAAVPVGQERHIVLSFQLANDAIFRFSMPRAAAARLSRSLSEVVGAGLN
ncbi:hypothetical protein [Amaricoccus sp. W119]|uniref:hypothetical protein n=1 Tax=Amaricoccus sp. W119 TaxID=3391833 RepID=UPI0039A4D3B3